MGRKHSKAKIGARYLLRSRGPIAELDKATVSNLRRESNHTRPDRKSLPDIGNESNDTVLDEGSLSELVNESNDETSDPFIGYNEDLPSSKLCRICKPIFKKHSYEQWSTVWQAQEQGHDSTSDPRWSSQHHRTLNSWKDAVRHDCFICSRLGPYPDDELFPLMYHLRVQTERSPLGSMTLIYELHIGAFSFEIETGFPVVIGEELGERAITRTWTGHEDFTTLARAWLDDCAKNHETCSKSFTTGWKPSRLLDISEDTIKLVPGSSVGVQEAYATLSHCWGPSPFSRLTSGGLQLYREGININNYEPTFRETIVAVRRLGLRYLWIDCYCIIQGDDDKAIEDWKYESRRMADVYSNSLLNIGALDSIGPADGLFRTRPLEAISGRVIWKPTHEEGRCLYRITRAPNNRENIKHSFEGLRECALLKRGWVVQECVLAPRMLSFSSEGALWQCSHKLASETAPAGRLVQSDGNTQRWLRLHIFWLLGDSSVRQPSIIEIKARWLFALTTYCE